jgi:phosphoribosylformylglycinamidine synthase
MKVGVVVFPGSNCDHDTYHVIKHVLGHEARFVWHKDSDLSGLDAVILPGGFSYGDYLRTGAIARFSPVMRAVGEFAAKGAPVLGICNGFQILQEAGLLPGAMLRNRDVKFLSQPVHLRVERTDTPATAGLRAGEVLTMPIAHGDGNFYLPDAELDRLEGEGQVVFRYTTRDGRLEPSANPNGSARAIAGVCNARRNVVGLMPHPERASELELGSADGRRILEALVGSLVGA